MVALTVRIDDRLALRLRLAAVDEGRSQAEIVREAIMNYLRTNGADSIESLEQKLR